MACWNIEFVGRGSVFQGWQELKTLDPDPLLLLNIPYFHISIIPLFHWLSDDQDHPLG